MSTVTLSKQLDKVVSNLTVEDQAVYTRKVGIDLFKEMKAGNIPEDELEHRFDVVLSKITDTMEYVDAVRFIEALHKDAIRVAIEAYKEMDRNHKIAVICGIDATRRFLEEILNHEATQSAWHEDRLYHAYPADKAVRLVEEDIKERKEAMLPIFQGLKQSEQERNELLNPKLWEGLGGVPEIEPYQTLLTKRVRRICPDSRLLPASFADADVSV
ncbi:hypothetical protein [Methanolobus sp.]|uniref:hypothetical protein n=1 Tax=Methanolobus sp. TaxID=1874737 RepID=UPI0025FF236B|nr:hypothetical protein [Methanolobus sp.]